MDEPPLSHSPRDYSVQQAHSKDVHEELSGTTKKGTRPLLPSIDRSENTRYACFLVVVVSGIVLIPCLLVLIVLFALQSHAMTNKYPVYTTLIHWINVSSPGAEVLALIINLVVTGCIEGLAYIHATSLRWALYKEDRLKYNTNLRLFTSAHSTKPNKWYTNILLAASLIVSYASTSLLFLKLPMGVAGDYPNADTSAVYINPVALCGLLIGISSHWIVAVWCLRDTRHILTWSSNPLTNTLAVLHTGRLQRRPGRCMMDVNNTTTEAKPYKPRVRQENLRKCIPLAHRITTFIWISVLLSVVWGAVVFLWAGGGEAQNAHKRQKLLQAFWTPPTSEVDAGRAASLALEGPHGYPIGLQCFLALLFVGAVQGLMTLCLNLVELLMNASRDERCWRNAAKLATSGGARLTTNTLAFALQSWEFLVLLIMKTVLHWLMGQSLCPQVEGFAADEDDDHAFGTDVIGFDMVYGRVFVFGFVTLLFGIFVTFLNFRKLKGPQPATWGHLQTLADLIDDRNCREGHIWWGDKGTVAVGIHHAGTSDRVRRLGEIDLDAMYAGNKHGRTAY